MDSKKLLFVGIGIGVEILVIHQFLKEANKNHKDFGGKVAYGISGALVGAAISGAILKMAGVKLAK